MKGKAVFTWVLLAFVAISLGRVAVTHWLPAAGTESAAPVASSDLRGADAAGSVAPSTAAGQTASAAAEVPTSAPGDRIAPVVTRMQTPRAGAAPSAPAVVGKPVVAEPEQAPAKAIVYYFHGAVRCKTCRTIEDFTREALDDGFSQDLKSGRIELLLVNVDDPKHEHFVQDYQLTARSVVLSRVDAGRQTAWRRLDWVWELVKDHDSFIREFQRELRALLETQG